jgi:hypothetical protein
MLNICFMGFQSDMNKIYFNKFIVSVYKYLIFSFLWIRHITLKSEGEVTSLSGADKREVRDNREKWWEYREKSKYFSNCTTFHIRGAKIIELLTARCLQFALLNLMGKDG